MNARRLATRANLLLAAVLMLAVWVLLVWAASRPALKTLIDLTPQQVNSVDPATEALLQELREKKTEIEFHLFFPSHAGQAANEEMLQWLRIRQRLQDLTGVLLRRYQWLGGESVTILRYDLQTDVQRTREAAQRFGYSGDDDTVVVAVRQAGREQRFRSLSLVADLADIELPQLAQATGPAQKRVPVLKRFVGEQGLSSALKGLLVQGTPVAYVLRDVSPDLNTDNQVIGGAYGKFFTGLRNLGFEVRPLTFSRERVVPRDASLVVVLEPLREFTDGDATALFEYVQRGGRLFLNYVWSPVESRNPEGGKLGELLGYRMGTQPVLHLIPDRSGRTTGPGYDNHEAVAKLQLALNPDHAVTKRLAQAGTALEVGGARPILDRPSPPGGMRREPLLQTGPYAWLGRTGGDGRLDLRAPPQNLLQPYLVGLAIEVDAVGEQGAAAPAPGQVVVVSGAFANNSGVELFGDLAYNVCNWMAERKVLMNIQGSQYTARQMRLQPAQVERVRWFLCYGVPGLFLLLGGAVLFQRRRI